MLLYQERDKYYVDVLCHLFKKIPRINIALVHNRIWHCTKLPLLARKMIASCVLISHVTRVYKTVLIDNHQESPQVNATMATN